MKYCCFCGKQLNDDETCTCPGVLEKLSLKPAKTNNLPIKNSRPLGICFVTILIALIAVITITSTSQSTIDLAEYIVIEEVTGLNGDGVLTYGLDTDALVKVLWGEDPDQEITKENFESIILENIAKYEEIYNALACISISADKSEHLSNGDIVTVTAEFKMSEKYSLSYLLQSGSKTYKVSGLKEGKTVDPFNAQYVSVIFSGFSGTGEADFEVLSDEIPTSFFRYSLSDRNGLKNGDVITMFVTANAQELTDHGYLMPENLQKTFVVSGLEEYFDIASGFPGNELKVLCEKALQSALEEDKENDIWADISVPSSIQAAYFLSAKDLDVPYRNFSHGAEFLNAVIVLTNCTLDFGAGFGEIMEWNIWVFPNYIIDNDGNLSYEDDNVFSIDIRKDKLEAVFAWITEEFDVMNINQLMVSEVN